MVNLGFDYNENLRLEVVLLKTIEAIIGIDYHILLKKELD
ncbi:conserved hypothetical protein [Listeria monocytogenes]|nr:hypothetical protein LMOf2365_1251 [Listeria monocytogenes serotype 4b str. F2365]AIZ38526.1 hypothetical protein LMntsn_1237 [Listeria monocytogenes]EAL08883.1 conserved hypothetical protein [Listeria monocytogenes str. 4b H7858] [Listeria monocytogenes serotype 4b str. H7858]EGJ24777.1 hypothetical protein LMOSA_21610 [Listeria monocytogenes str. Scott A]EXL15205.1 hypothetical protein X845_1865 [Listeria monocytogenes Lm_1824]EXL20576.1 hypothetical protein X846_2506 [Listeria monocytoge